MCRKIDYLENRESLWLSTVVPSYTSALGVVCHPKIAREIDFQKVVPGSKDSYLHNSSTAPEQKGKLFPGKH